MAENTIYKCKEVDFHGEKRNILYRQHGHSRTALLALANCMLLKGSMTITPEADNDYPLQSVTMRMGRNYRRKHSSVGGDSVITKNEMDNSVGLLSSLIDVDIGFTSNSRIRSSTVRLDMFDHMDVKLLHAWLVQSDDAIVLGAVGTGYHHVFAVDYLVGPKVPDINTDPLVQNFLRAEATTYGIQELQNSTQEGQICALFWKGSFHTLTKHNGTLYLLNNVIDALDKDLLWKEFNERGDGQLCNRNFVTAPMGENKSEESQTAPSVSKHKCQRQDCHEDFLSEVNLNRHKQVHAKNTNVKMTSFSKVELSEHWDELSLEEAGKILSIEDMKIQGISGGLLCRLIEKVGDADEIYIRANRMKAVLDGTKKISSDELFTVLDEDSENTSFSTDIRSCPENVIFSMRVLLLRDLNNVLACCCYFVEKNLVSSWLVRKSAEATRHATSLLQESDNSLTCGKFGCTMKFTSEMNFTRHKHTHLQTEDMDFMENMAAIGKYWDDLTCDQARQIVSLKGIRIKGFNLKNLKQRLKTCDQNDPLAMTAKQLIDILGSSEKMTSRDMFDVLEKASEETCFSNDIRDCKDDVIFEVGVNRCTPSNDVALLSYVIERQLVQNWFLSNESVTSDVQGKIAQDQKSEQSDTVEPVNIGGSNLLEKRDSMDSKAGEAGGVPTSQDILNPISGDTAESRLGPGHSGSGSTSLTSLDPFQGILLEEFIRSNKLTKIYKYVFKVLKKSLETLKKDFESQIPKRKLKAIFKLTSVILTRSGRKCARGFLLWIVKNHREGKNWNGSFDLSDMQVVNKQFIISKAAEMELSLESASADFKRLWELLFLPFYTNAQLGSYPIYFDEFGNDILHLPDPVKDPDAFMKYEKYLALHFAFMPPLSRLTLLISLYKVYESDRVVAEHTYEPLNQQMSYDWRDGVRTLPILTDVYFYNVHGHLRPYTPSYFHLLKFSRHFGSHDLDHTKLSGVTQLVTDVMVTDLVIGQLLAASLAELILFIVNHSNMEGRFFRSFQQFESSDDEVFFCVEDDHDDSVDSGSSDADEASA